MTVLGRDLCSLIEVGDKIGRVGAELLLEEIIATFTYQRLVFASMLLSVSFLLLFLPATCL